MRRAVALSVLLPVAVLAGVTRRADAHPVACARSTTVLASPLQTLAARVRRRRMRTAVRVGARSSRCRSRIRTAFRRRCRCSTGCVSAAALRGTACDWRIGPTVRPGGFAPPTSRRRSCVSASSWMSLRTSSRSTARGMSCSGARRDRQAVDSHAARHVLRHPAFRRRSATGAYGPRALGISAFSNVLRSWRDGGPIGIHGTDETFSIGKPVSHGCVRLPNDLIIKLFAVTPLGTPVVIQP